MKVSLCIYEDNYFENFYPLTYSRPVFDLLSGAFSLADKIKNHYRYSGDVNFLCRDIFEKNSLEEIKDYDSVLFINGRLLAEGDLNEVIPLEGPNEIFVKDEDLVALRINKQLIDKVDFENPDFLSNLNISQVTEVNVFLVEYIWDLIELNDQEIINDFAFLKSHIYTIDDYPENISLMNRDNILIGEGCNIYPFVCVDAKNGPVIIGKNVTILPNTYIQGPAYIGDDCIIKANTKIYHNTSIGKVCKLAGEIENTIIHSYSNKQHDGFLGHSYLGSWINLGAGTTNSDLKNNYSNINLNYDGETLETGMRFLGMLMGDHSKTAINTTINTGSIIGFSCNLYGDVFSSKFYPSFSWGGGKDVVEYDLEKSKKVAKVVMSRRNKKFSNIDDNLFNNLFESSKESRKKF